MKRSIIIPIVCLLSTLAGFGAPPPNDNFADATVQTGSYWLVAGTLFGATGEGNEPILTGLPNGPTAWWRWTATATGQVRVRTWGSEEPTLLAVYRGATLDTTRLEAYSPSHFSRANSAEAVFSAVAGESYSIQVLGADYASPTFIPDPFDPSRIQLSLTFTTGDAPPPPNDAFDHPQVLAGSTADVVVSTAGASSEPGEPFDMAGAQGNSVWLEWTAPSDGVWQIDAERCDFDSVLAVYTGSAISSLSRLDYADDEYTRIGDPFVGGGRLTFGAQAGIKYRIQVQGAALAGASLEYGNVRLMLQPVDPPANDDFAAATILKGSSPAAEGWTTFAHREPAEPPAKADQTRSLWWRWTAPDSGLLAVIEYEGAVDAYTGTTLTNLVRPPYAPNAAQRGSLGGVTDWYSVTAGTTLWFRGRSLDGRVLFTLRTVQPPANDDFAARKTLEGSTVGDTVDMEYASWENSEPQTDGFGPQSVWYRWIALSSGRFIVSSQGSPSFTRVQVFTGTALDALARAGEEKLAGYSPHAYGRVILDASAGTEYAIQLRRESVVTGLDHVGIRPASPPANDNFASATVMSGGAWTASGSNRDATGETNEPFNSLSDGETGASVWWQWTAPAGGLYRLTTAGSAINTVLVIYTGTAMRTLTRVAQNQDGGWGSAGSLTFAASPGTSYYFQVDGQGREEGALRLALSPVATPSNDAFAARLPLVGASVFAGGTVLGATPEAGDPAISGAAGGQSVWYEWTAPASGNASFRVIAQRFEPAFGMYTGEALQTLQPAMTSGSGAPTSVAQTFLSSYPVSKGASYKIQINGSPVDNGGFQLWVIMSAPPVNDAFETRSILSGIVVHSSSNNEGATRQAGEPAHAGIGAGFSVWWEWTAPVSGPVAMDTAGGAAQARLAVYTGTSLKTLSVVASNLVVYPKTFSSLSFTAAEGVTYIIAADSGARGAGDIALNIVAGSATPSNDNFASATVWASDQAEALARPLDASAETGEPAHGGRPAVKSLWWAWKPLTTRRASIWMETESESRPARLAVYKGNALDSLTALSAQTSDVHWTRREVDVLAGQTYYIVIDTPSLAVDPGWIKLGVAPVNGTMANAAAISPADGRMSANTRGAFNEDPAISPTALRQLWWTWVPQINARMEWRAFASAEGGVDISASSPAVFYNTVGNAASGKAVPGTGEIIGTFDAVAGAAYYLKVITRSAQAVSVQLAETIRQVPPSNDRQYRAQALAGKSWSIPLTLGAETDDRLFWTWTAPAAGVAELSLAGDLAANDAIFAYADAGLDMTAGASHTQGGPPVLRIYSEAGQQWTFATRSSLRRLRPATLSLVSPAPGTAPANDSWLTPRILPASWSRVSGDVTFASCQPGEPDHSASGGTHSATMLPPGRSIWFDWTPSKDGPVQLRLESTASLAMQIYRGRTQPEWQPMGVLMPESKVLSTYLLAGQTYHIAVATRPYDEQMARFDLSLGAAAANDMLSTASILAGPSASSSADTTGASIEPGEPGHGFNYETPLASLWWKWTAPATGLVWIDTRGSEFDSILAVFASDPPDATARVAENASSRPGVGASVVFPAIGGQLYFIRVCRGESGEPAGVARIHLSMSAPSDPYSNWLAAWPALTGASAASSADPDGDGLPNLAELAFGGNPFGSDASQGMLRLLPAPDGWHVEATLDRDALDALDGDTAIEVEWQLSRDLRQWQPGPPSQFVRRAGRLTLEHILITTNDPPFVRLAIRRRR
jgi:hypothetical protein